MPTDEPWQQLRVGDRIRIVRLPSGVDAPGYTFHRIARRRSLRICEIDSSGLPWVECRFKRKTAAGSTTHSRSRR